MEEGILITGEINEEKMEQLDKMFKYSIWAWDDTEEDEGETFIGYTDDDVLYFKVIWDYDYFKLVDNETGQEFVPRVREENGELA